MNYFERRRRHEFIDSLQQVTEETLNNPKLARHLKQGEIEPLKIANTQLFIPNVRRGRVVMPKDTGEAIPVVVLSHGENVDVSDATHDYTPHQRKKILAKFPESQEEWLYQRIFGETDSRHVARVSSGASATTFRRSISMPAVIYDTGEETRLNLSGRPLLAITPNPDFLTKKREVLPHELVHVLQDLAAVEAGEPVDLNVKHELQAYKITVAVIKALKLHRMRDGKLDPEATSAQKLETIRRKHNSFDEPYAVTEPLMAEIEIAGLLNLVQLKATPATPGNGIFLDV